MTNRPPVRRAFTTRPAGESFLGSRASFVSNREAETQIDRNFERIVYLLAKKTQAGRDKPR